MLDHEIPLPKLIYYLLFLEFKIIVVPLSIADLFEVKEESNKSKAFLANNNFDPLMAKRSFLANRFKAFSKLH